MPGKIRFGNRHALLADDALKGGELKHAVHQEKRRAVRQNALNLGNAERKAQLACSVTHILFFRPATRRSG
jgi:hypothetical protein